MRLRAMLGAVVCLALAAGAFLLAADVSRVEARLAVDDARFAARPDGGGYWAPEALLPARLARRVLAVEDDLQHRRAVQAFWLSGPRLPIVERERFVAERARAQQLLTEAEPRAETAQRRGQIANLRGVLALVTTSEGNRRSLAQAAADNFSRAVQRDPAAEDPKFNLEVMLKNADITTGSGTGGSGGAGRRKGSEFGGAASSSAGSGY